MGANPNTVRQPPARWLSIVGIGEDGIEGLSELAHSLIESAAVVFGGSRHLSLAASLIRGTARAWSSPFEGSVAEVLTHRGRQVCVLASGDPFQHGIGSLLARHVAPDETIAIPALSAFSLAASRLLWPLPTTALISLCGRSLDFIRPHLQAGARILALTSGASAPLAIAEVLCATGFGASRMTVLEALGGPRERVRSARASAFDLDQVSALNTVAIEVVADRNARILTRAAGLPDELFEHDGQITKKEIRALTMSALAPARGQHLWDIGAGSGSVAIEWMLADPSLTATAVERRSDRAARIKCNAAAFGVPDLQVVEGDAPQALQGLQPPDAIFVGGGVSSGVTHASDVTHASSATHASDATNTPGTQMGAAQVTSAASDIIDFARAALKPGGRLVINAVTLETEAVLLRMHAEHGGNLLRLEIQRAGPIGEQARSNGWRAARPIMQWTWIKP